MHFGLPHSCFVVVQGFMAKEIRSRRVEAVVLRHTDWGEADRLLVLYTRELGKVRAIAKGARKMRSRKAGHLQPFTRVVLLLAKGRDLWIVTQAEMQDSFQPLRENLLKTAYVSYVVEILDRFIYEEGESQGIYRLLVRTLKRISEEEDAYLAVRYFEIRMLDFLGFRPDLFHCVSCGKEIQPEDQYFSALEGGIRCGSCGLISSSRPISVQALRHLRHLQRSNYQDAKKLPIPPHIRDEIEAITHSYLTFLLERKLNSPSFLREVRGDYEKK